MSLTATSEPAYFYAFKECLHHGLSSDREIVGVLSLIIWSLSPFSSRENTSASSSRADNQGEGRCTLALLSPAFPNAVASSGRGAAGLIAARHLREPLCSTETASSRRQFSAISAVEGPRDCHGKDQALHHSAHPGHSGRLCLRCNPKAARKLPGKWFYSGDVDLVYDSGRAWHLSDRALIPPSCELLNPFEGFYFLTLPRHLLG